jgi:hypothetical protein
MDVTLRATPRKIALDSAGPGHQLPTRAPDRAVPALMRQRQLPHPTLTNPTPAAGVEGCMGVGDCASRPFKEIVVLISRAPSTPLHEIVHYDAQMKIELVNI